ncbi:LOW QUALITY PROTEIN: hypothetical protein CFOL_v3_03770, partial [Cephalotus follicularis]
MSCLAISLLCNILYHKRISPYNAFNVLGGLSNGKGRVFTYVAVGSYRVGYSSQGSSSTLIVPFL